METERDLTHVKQRGTVKFLTVENVTAARAKAALDLAIAVHNRAIEEAAALAEWATTKCETSRNDGTMYRYERRATGPEIAAQIRAKLLRTP